MICISLDLCSHSCGSRRSALYGAFISCLLSIFGGTGILDASVDLWWRRRRQHGLQPPMTAVVVTVALWPTLVALVGSSGRKGTRWTEKGAHKSIRKATEQSGHPRIVYIRRPDRRDSSSIAPRAARVEPLDDVGALSYDGACSTHPTCPCSCNRAPPMTTTVNCTTQFLHLFVARLPPISSARPTCTDPSRPALGRRTGVAETRRMDEGDKRVALPSAAAARKLFLGEEEWTAARLSDWRPSDCACTRDYGDTPSSTSGTTPLFQGDSCCSIGTVEDRRWIARLGSVHGAGSGIRPMYFRAC